MVSNITGLPISAVQDVEVLAQGVSSRNANTDNKASDKAANSTTKTEASATEDKSTTGIKQEANVDYTALAKKMSSSLGDENINIEFERDETTQKMVMKLIDKTTKEVVQQYPPEITLKIARIVAANQETGNLTNATV